MADTVIGLTGIVTRFGERVVHDGIDLAVRRGEVLALVGGSGSGKTTLLREMIGLLRPAAGRVTAFDRDLQALRGTELASDHSTGQRRRQQLGSRIGQTDLSELARNQMRDFASRENPRLTKWKGHIVGNR